MGGRGLTADRPRLQGKEVDVLLGASGLASGLGVVLLMHPLRTGGLGGSWGQRLLRSGGQTPGAGFVARCPVAGRGAPWSWISTIGGMVCEPRRFILGLATWRTSGLSQGSFCPGWSDGRCLPDHPGG